jgi:hypothetical protein
MELVYTKFAFICPKDTRFPAVLKDIGFRRTPDKNPFFVFRTLSKDNVVEPFDR